MRSILNWIKDEYNNPPVLITENGMSDRNGSLEDDHRIYYYKHYINYMLQGKSSVPKKNVERPFALVMSCHFLLFPALSFQFLLFSVISHHK